MKVLSLEFSPHWRERKGLACVHDEMRCDTRGYRVLLLRQKVFHSRRASEVEDSIWSEG